MNPSITLNTNLGKFLSIIYFYLRFVSPKKITYLPLLIVYPVLYVNNTSIIL
jgi:hypothetical protein